MKKSIGAAALAASLAGALPAHAFITGDLTGGGVFNGSVTSYSAWIQSNALDGNEVNFWTLSGQAGDKVTVSLGSSDIEFGLSLYLGEVEAFELFVPGFDNEGDFADNVFVAGTPAFGASGTTLVDVVLPATGLYTLAVGGEEFFAPGESFAYSLDVDVAPVPLPGAAWLLGSALATFAVRRRRDA